MRTSWWLAALVAFPTVFALVAIPLSRPGGGGEEVPASGDIVTLAAPTFAAPLAIDNTRPGGEPVVIALSTGEILVSGHAGYTHFRPTSVPTSMITGMTGGPQTLMWRSTDGGTTWSHIGQPLLGGNIGPRDIGVGWSDPDWAVDPAGNVYHTELYLGDITVRKSFDRGATWTQTNPAASPLPVDDRQWIATWGASAQFGAQKVYLMFNNLALDWTFLTSTDGGFTFPSIKFIAEGNPPGKMTVDPRDGTIYIGNGAAVWRSTTQGNNWVKKTVPGHDVDCCLSLSAPVVDDKGNLYHVWSEENSIWLAVSSNKGDTWKTVKQVQHFSGTHIWPWVVAGAEGRVGVAWLGTTRVADPEVNTGPWHVFYTVSLNGNSTGPTFSPTQVTVTPAHANRVCTTGLTCWALLGDRRLGDFLTVTADATGHALVAYPSTQTNEAVSHAMFAKQTGGDLLR